MSDTTIEATVSRCANGHDVYVVMLNEFRLFGRKCCGQWEIVRRFTTTLVELREDLVQAVPEFAAPVLSAEERELLDGIRQDESGPDESHLECVTCDRRRRRVALLDRLLGASR